MKYFVPHTPEVQWAGFAVMVAGLGFACWARVHLGTNWSGVVTLKEGHELIRTGPYRNVRHPIYTGILIGFLGWAIVGGQVRGLIGMAVVWLSFYIKARREEKLLTQEFGPKFEEHSRLTGDVLAEIFIVGMARRCGFPIWNLRGLCGECFKLERAFLLRAAVVAV